MEKLKQIIADQIESILSVYNPYQDKLSDKQKQDLAGFKECLQILKKER